MAKTEIYKLELIDLNTIQIEISTAFLNEFGIAAIEEHETGIVLYERDKELLNSARDLLLENVNGVDLRNISLNVIEDRNWNEEWEASFAPIIIGDFCAIKAKHHNDLITAKHIITINPELAFGTGHHETTYQMISMMQNLEFDKRSMLDYGCGTGILAILAAQLGANKIDAIDHDARAVQCAEDCISINQTGRIKVYHSTLEDFSGAGYDIILANINRNILLQSSEMLSKKLRKNGILLLSGILNVDQEMILEKYANFKLIELSSKGNWSCMSLELL